MINTKRQLAAIDLGSNSFHMVVARVQNGQLHTIDKIKEMVRLAEGLDEHNLLSEEKMEEALACLRRFGQRIKDLPPENVAAVGTNTLRKAHNSWQFLLRAEQALGFPISIVAGQEEARLVYQGVAHTLAQTEDYRLVIDIGGGSTEFIIGKAYQPILMESLGMGCVSFTRKWFGDGVITEQRLRSAIIDGRRKLEWISDAYLEHGWQETIGSSGTIKAISKVLRDDYGTDGWIDYPHLRKLADLFVTAGRIDHIVLNGLPENRAPVIIGGLCVLMAAFEELHIERMMASDGALREGLLNDMIETSHGHDIRDETVRDFELRYHIDTAQAGRIAFTALQLHDQIGLPKDRPTHKLLHWAARLHEVGLSISHSNYPNHSGYIIEQSDMPGFSREKQNLLGLLMRLQRGKLRMELIEAMPRLPEDFDLILILLRLAIILERGRDWDSQRKLKLKRKGRKLKLKFPEHYLEEHPLTEADLNQERLEVEKLGYKLKIR